MPDTGRLGPVAGVDPEAERNGGQQEGRKEDDPEEGNQAKPER